MPTIRDAIAALRQEEQHLAHHLETVRAAITALSDVTVTGRRHIRKAAKTAKKKARTMTTAQRKAVSKRMKAYWAARKKVRKE